MQNAIKKVLTRRIINTPTILTRYLADALPKLRRRILIFDAKSQALAYEQTDHFSAKELYEIQLRKLRETLIHTGKFVPHWRDLFHSIEFYPEDLTDFRDLGAIPVITRAQLKNIPTKNLLSEAGGSWRRLPVSTSGSTGEPLRFFQDFALDVPCRRAALLLSMHYAGFKCKKPLITIGMQDYWQLRGFAKDISPGAVLESNQFRKETFYPLLTTYRPRVIQASASHIRRLAFHWKHDGFRFPLDGIVSMGEAFIEEEREELVDFFQCPLTDSYGTRECHPIGMRCAFGSYHLVPWLNYVEIVDNKGESCRNGLEGSIVVTSFTNEVMPFIRYQVGDQGKIEERLCNCGRTSRTIVFTGRTPTFIRLPGGEQVTIRFFEQILLQYHRQIKVFQVKQLSLDSFVISYVPNLHMNLNEAEAAGKLNMALGQSIQREYPIQIKFQKVDSIMPNARGKTLCFVSNLAQAATYT